jgi:hypothetical protein
MNLTAPPPQDRLQLTRQFEAPRRGVGGKLTAQPSTFQARLCHYLLLLHSINKNR